MVVYLSTAAAMCCPALIQVPLLKNPESNKLCRCSMVYLVPLIASLYMSRLNQKRKEEKKREERK